MSPAYEVDFSQWLTRPFVNRAVSEAAADLSGKWVSLWVLFQSWTGEGNACYILTYLMSKWKVINFNIFICFILKIIYYQAERREDVVGCDERRWAINIWVGASFPREEKQIIFILFFLKNNPHRTMVDEPDEKKPLTATVVGWGVEELSNRERERESWERYANSKTVTHE